MYCKVFSFLAVLLFLTACAAPAAAGPRIHIENAWARPADANPMGEANGTTGMQDMSRMPGMSGSGMNSAAYFLIVNDGSEADSLIGITSEVASSTEMHETRIENNVAQMLPVSRVEVPAHASIEFKPGSYHVMLVGLTQDLKAENTLKLTLQFEKSGDVTLDVPIRQEQ